MTSGLDVGDLVLLLCDMVIREPWFSGYGRRLVFKTLDGRFFTLVCCKTSIVCLFEKTENK